MYTIPTPYEYALITQASYCSDAENLKTQHTKTAILLTQKGWHLESIICDGAYRGSIWINRALQHVVIAHQNVQDISAWTSDIDAMLQAKPGSLVRAAINTLSHERVLHYLAQGYRLSTTGHVLGGFLAQICVYASTQPALLSDNLGSNGVASSSSSTLTPTPSTHALSTMVFDSPGAINFLTLLHKQLGANAIPLDLRQLNVHNFCLIPTAINTYGMQGTVWHLSDDAFVFSFKGLHSISQILKKLIDADTGLPKKATQKRDWPQANYSAYPQVSATIAAAARDAIKVPFIILNELHKRCDKHKTPDWHEKTCEQIEQNLSNSHIIATDAAALPSLRTGFNVAFKAQSGTSKSDTASPVQQRLALHHFAPEVQQFLQDLIFARSSSIEVPSWNRALEQHYGDFAPLLNTFHIEIDGIYKELVLPAFYPDNIFVFQQELSLLIDHYGLLSFSDFLTAEFARLQQELKQAQIAQEKHNCWTQKSLSMGGFQTLVEDKIIAPKTIGLSGMCLGEELTKIQMDKAQRWYSIPAEKRLAILKKPEPTCELEDNSVFVPAALDLREEARPPVTLSERGYFAAASSHSGASLVTIGRLLSTPTLLLHAGESDDSTGFNPRSTSRLLPGNL